MELASYAVSSSIDCTFMVQRVSSIYFVKTANLSKHQITFVALWIAKISTFQSTCIIGHCTTTTMGVA